MFRHRRSCFTREQVRDPEEYEFFPTYRKQSHDGMRETRTQAQPLMVVENHSCRRAQDQLVQRQPSAFMGSNEDGNVMFFGGEECQGWLGRKATLHAIPRSSVGQRSRTCRRSVDSGVLNATEQRSTNGIYIQAPNGGFGQSPNDTVLFQVSHEPRVPNANLQAIEFPPGFHYSPSYRDEYPGLNRRAAHARPTELQPLDPAFYSLRSRSAGVPWRNETHFRGLSGRLDNHVPVLDSSHVALRTQLQSGQGSLRELGNDPHSTSRRMLCHNLHFPSHHHSTLDMQCAQHSHKEHVLEFGGDYINPRGIERSRMRQNDSYQAVLRRARPLEDRVLPKLAVTDEKFRRFPRRTTNLFPDVESDRNRKPERTSPELYLCQCDPGEYRSTFKGARGQKTRETSSCEGKSSRRQMRTSYEPPGSPIFDKYGNIMYYISRVEHAGTQEQELSEDPAQSFLQKINSSSPTMNTDQDIRVDATPWSHYPSDINRQSLQHVGQMLPSGALIRRECQGAQRSTTPRTGSLKRRAPICSISVRDDNYRHEIYTPHTSWKTTPTQSLQRGSFGPLLGEYCGQALQQAGSSPRRKRTSTSQPLSNEEHPVSPSQPLKRNVEAVYCPSQKNLGRETHQMRRNRGRPFCEADTIVIPDSSDDDSECVVISSVTKCKNGRDATKIAVLKAKEAEAEAGQEILRPKSLDDTPRTPLVQGRSPNDAQLEAEESIQALVRTPGNRSLEEPGESQRNVSLCFSIPDTAINVLPKDSSDMLPFKNRSSGMLDGNHTKGTKQNTAELLVHDTESTVTNAVVSGEAESRDVLGSAPTHGTAIYRSANIGESNETMIVKGRSNRVDDEAYPKICNSSEIHDKSKPSKWTKALRRDAPLGFSDSDRARDNSGSRNPSNTQDHGMDRGAGSSLKESKNAVSATEKDSQIFGSSLYEGRVGRGPTPFKKYRNCEKFKCALSETCSDHPSGTYPSKRRMPLKRKRSEEGNAPRELPSTDTPALVPQNTPTPTSWAEITDEKKCNLSLGRITGASTEANMEGEEPAKQVKRSKLPLITPVDLNMKNMEKGSDEAPITPEKYKIKQGNLLDPMPIKPLYLDEGGEFAMSMEEDIDEYPSFQDLIPDYEKTLKPGIFVPREANRIVMVLGKRRTKQGVLEYLVEWETILLPDCRKLTYENAFYVEQHAKALVDHYVRKAKNDKEQVEELQREMRDTYQSTFSLQATLRRKRTRRQNARRKKAKEKFLTKRNSAGQKAQGRRARHRSPGQNKFGRKEKEQKKRQETETRHKRVIARKSAQEVGREKIEVGVAGRRKRQKKTVQEQRRSFRQGQAGR